MKLPGAEGAIVREEKIRNYLLSATHPEGRSKARFFTAFGFTDQNWDILESALREHALQNDALLSKQTLMAPFMTSMAQFAAPMAEIPLSVLSGLLKRSLRRRG